MNKRSLQTLLRILILASSIWPVLVFSQAVSLQDRYFKLYDLSLQRIRTSDKIAQLREYYASAIEAHRAGLPRDTPGAVSLLYKADNLMSFYTGDATYAAYMKEDVDRLEALHSDTSQAYRDIYGAYVETRNFAAAKRVLARHSVKGVDPLPDVTGTIANGRPGIMLLKPGGVLSKQVADLSGARIVVVGHPLCHFTQNAMKYIQGDRRLQKIFAGHALWIVPPERSFELDLIGDWNRLHPQAPMSLAYDRGGWNKLSSWDTPTFYFFQNGQLKSTVEGWPEGGNAKAIDEALKRISLDK